MLLLGWLVLAVSWCAWAYPFIFLAPHNQKRPSITAIGPTRLGLFLESLAIFLAFAFRMPSDPPPEWWRIAAAAPCGIAGATLAWTAVRHLGPAVPRSRRAVRRSRTGDQRTLRDCAPSDLHFAAGDAGVQPVDSERVAMGGGLPGAVRSGNGDPRSTEDGLLASRFGERFFEYRERVRAYMPFVR